ncbi:MAG: hypothetical protein AB7F32_04110 [Victivallaceae bacterium]
MRHKIEVRLVHPDSEIIAKKTNSPERFASYTKKSSKSDTIIAETIPSMTIICIEDAYGVSGNPNPEKPIPAPIYEIVISLLPDDRKHFAKLISENIGRLFAVFVDNEYIFSSVTRAPIINGVFMLQIAEQDKFMPLLKALQKMKK